SPGKGKVGHTLFFFFFQAEDGIRDFHVTGVQTCALPISFQTFCTDTGLDGSYRRWVSWKRKPQLSSARESLARWDSPVEPITTEIRRWSPRLAEAIRQ